MAAKSLTSTDVFDQGCGRGDSNPYALSGTRT